MNQNLEIGNMWLIRLYATKKLACWCSLREDETFGQ